MLEYGLVDGVWLPSRLKYGSALGRWALELRLTYDEVVRED